MNDRYLNFGFDRKTGEMLPEAKILLAWWNELDTNTRDSASLRRCDNINDVVFVPSFHKLLYRLKRAVDVKYYDSLAIVACVISHIRENTGVKLATQMASSKGANVNSIVLIPRLNQLLSVRNSNVANSDDKDELLMRMINVVKLLDGRASVLDVANTIYWWNEKTKKDLSYAYYGKLFDKQ